MKRSRSELEIYNAALLKYAQKQTKYINGLWSWRDFPFVCDECGCVLPDVEDDFSMCYNCSSNVCENCTCTCWMGVCKYPRCRNIKVDKYCVFHAAYPREKKYFYNSSIGDRTSYIKDFKRRLLWNVFSHKQYGREAHKFVMFLLLCLRKLIPCVKDMQKYIIGIIMNEWDAIEMDIWKHVQK